MEICIVQGRTSVKCIRVIDRFASSIFILSPRLTHSHTHNIVQGSIFRLTSYLRCMLHTHVKYKCHVLFRLSWMTTVINVLLWVYSSIIPKMGDRFRFFHSHPLYLKDLHKTIHFDYIIISNISPFSHNKRTFPLCLSGSFLSRVLSNHKWWYWVYHSNG